MISSMTAFSNTRLQSEQLSVNVEVKSVNSRYLDLTLKIPDQLSALEAPLRQLINEEILRGKIEIRIQFQTAGRFQDDLFAEDAIQLVNDRLQHIRTHLPDTPAPNINEIIALIKYENRNRRVDRETLYENVLQATKQALDEFDSMRRREGERLAAKMAKYLSQIRAHVSDVEACLPSLIEEQRAKIRTRLIQALESAAPEGLQYISGEELSARIAAEGAAFSLKVDVAEELTRLHSHCDELELMLRGARLPEPADRSARPAAEKASVGKRMDFIFQEMNREINTLGSKSASLKITNSVIDMKLLVEQLREQALNIE